MIISLMILPSLAKSVSADSAVNLYVNSGIAGYYNSISKAAFDMTHRVLQELGVSSEQTSKKEVPAKNETENNDEAQAVILDNASKKSVKTIVSFTPVFYETANNFEKPAVSANFDFLFAGWMLFFVLMCIFSVRKKDDCGVYFNYYYISRRPIVL
jgi:hypothetical protein